VIQNIENDAAKERLLSFFFRKNFCQCGQVCLKGGEEPKGSACGKQT
jgi:hypothetical protein